MARAKVKDEYTLPDLQARGLAALCEEFFSQPGVEEEYQAWLESKKKKRGGRGKISPSVGCTDSSLSEGAFSEVKAL